MLGAGGAAVTREPCNVCGSSGFCFLAGERGAPMHPRPTMTYPPARRVMRLWRLIRPQDTVGYDEHEGFVVRAENELEARLIVLREVFEGEREDWALAKCEEVTAEGGPGGEPGIVLKAFVSG